MSSSVVPDGFDPQGVLNYIQENTVSTGKDAQGRDVVHFKDGKSALASFVESKLNTAALAFKKEPESYIHQFQEFFKTATLSLAPEEEIDQLLSGDSSQQSRCYELALFSLHADEIIPNLLARNIPVDFNKTLDEKTFLERAAEIFSKGSLSKNAFEKLILNAFLNQKRIDPRGQEILEGIMKFQGNLDVFKEKWPLLS